MHVKALRIRNFRRLKNVQVDLAQDISIFVGANNSGKTSATHALQLFLAASRDRFSIHDFSADTWAAIDAFGNGDDAAAVPTMSLDLWLAVLSEDLHRVFDLLPGLTRTYDTVGVRIELIAIDPAGMRARFVAARDLARENLAPAKEGEELYQPSPRTLCEFLEDNLRKEFELRYYKLDPAQFDASLNELAGYRPQILTPDQGRTGKEVLGSLVKVDFLSAQRHLSDSSEGSRSEDLSRCLSRFYSRNLEKHRNDPATARALDESETQLNNHLARVFGPTLQSLAQLGYPGLGNPRLLIKTALNPATIMSSQDGAKVHYLLGDAAVGADVPTLPDKYNGLGFKNLIYMVVELLDLHAQWSEIEENRPPLHLIFIEEPEAHLHAQLQQVFIHKVLDLLELPVPDRQFYSSQIVVTTHSPHILYERGFKPIRYFRRTGTAVAQSSEVLNLSAFYDNTANPVRDFLERYLKLTHCDLFFADAAVLVEGNVERLLLPHMIEKAAIRLKSSYLSVLEIGGAFGHRFRSLVEFLGITVLIITDIDSVEPRVAVAAGADDDESGTACMAGAAGAVTSNQTLVQWLPARHTIADLLAATAEHRLQPRTTACQALARVTYQTKIEVTWAGDTAELAGRTLEEAFALENLAWCQHEDRAELKLRIRGGDRLTLAEMAKRLHRRVKSSSFGKTDFALGLLAQDPAGWVVPTYIAEGLRWLEGEVAPPPPPAPEAELVLVVAANP